MAEKSVYPSPFLLLTFKTEVPGIMIDIRTIIFRIAVSKKSV